MPISQSRMIALINAGRDYQQAFAEAVRLVRAENELMMQGKIDGRDAMLNMSRLVDEHLLAKPDSPTVLAVEHRHFKSNAGYNKRERDRQARRRRDLDPEGKHRVTRHVQENDLFLDDPEQPTSTAPRTLVRPNYLEGRDGVSRAAQFEADFNRRKLQQSPAEPINQPLQQLATPLTEAEQKFKAKAEAEAKAQADTGFSVPEDLIETPPGKPISDSKALENGTYIPKLPSADAQKRLEEEAERAHELAERKKELARLAGERAKKAEANPQEGEPK